ncbi:hypothetical protein Tco_0458959, partial [Tanacetum coccineum]
FDNHQPQEIPEVVPFIKSKEWIETKNELYKLMEAYTERMNQQREQEALLAAQREKELLAQKQVAQEKEEPPQNYDFRQLIKEICDLIESALNSKHLSIKLKSQRLVQEKQEVKNIAEPTAKRRTRITSCLQNFKFIHKDIIIPLNNTPLISLVNAITYDLPSECDFPINDESSPTFTTFSNPLFDSNDDFSSSDDESLSNEDFSGELAHINPIPPGIEEADFDLEEEIRLVKNLSYDNSSPRPPEELNEEIANMILESLSPSPIPVEDSDSHMEEIDLFLATDDSMPPGIENDDYDSEGDILFLEELLSNDPFPLPEIESSNLDHFNDPSSPRPPPEPPDVEISLNFEPDAPVINNVDELNEDECFDPGGGEINVEVDNSFTFITRTFLPFLTYPEVSPLLSSTKNEDTIFDPGIST